MVSGAPELELGAEGGPGDQVRWFGEAVAAFAKALGKPMPVLSERFPAPAGAVEPFVLMQGRALLAVLDQGPGREDPRDLPLDELAASLMGHERRRWRAVAASWEWGSGTAPSEQVQGRAVAALALLGADTKTEAAEIVQRVPELGDAPAERVAAVVSWAAGLYPGGPGVAPLIRPALIGEWFVVSELTADPDLARSVRAGMSQEQAARALGFLARAADHLEAASGLFKDFAGGDLNRLILAAVLAARTGEAGRRLLDPAIASQIAAADDWTLDQLTGLQATVPGYLLLQTHVTIARLVVTARRALAAADPARQANLADALDNLGAWLGRVGRYREALEATEEAIALYRPLAAEGPAYQANLADALDNLGVRLGRVARYREALEATEEAIALYRPLAAEGPAHQANLARALDNLGVDLDRVARYREALEATEEAIALYRPLAAEGPAHQANLARALDNLGVDLDRVGRYREALEATEEAIALYRPLAAEDPAHQANLARALDNLGVDLDRVARYREALEAAEEAIALYRPLAADNPAHQANLARALDNLGVDLDRVGRYREALQATEEAIALYRPLAADNPAHQANLARALDNLGVDLGRVGRYREALQATEEAIALYRPLAADNPAHQANLAHALDNLGVELDRVGRYREALQATEEAIALHRPLAADNPAHQANLAHALNNLGARLDQVGRSAEALAARTEAVQVYRDLARAGPGLYRDAYQRALRALRQELDQKGMHDKAMTLGLTEPN